MFFIDFKGAYNGVNHEILVSKLRKKGIGFGTINLIKYYFNTIAFEEDNQLWKLGKGLPQGSISAPMLFDIFIDDLSSDDKMQIWVKSKYADDILTIGWGIEVLI